MTDPFPMPKEFWDNVELDIDFLQEEKHYQEWLLWRQLSGS